MSRPRHYADAAKAKRMTPDHFPDAGNMVDDDDDTGETECTRCHGDGTDPWCDHLLPCPECQGGARP